MGHILNKRKKVLRVLTFFSVFILLAVTFHPAINPIWKRENLNFFEGVTKSIGTSNTIVDSENYYSSYWDIDVFELIDATPPDKQIDSDGDGLYDSVEKVLGTDINNNDSDFDQLDDYFEATNNLDPLNPDSNNDGISDYIEMSNITIDLDNDNTINAWDSDNDNDGVSDNVDLSPFTKSEIYNRFSFDIITNGNPTFMNFQIRPKEEDHLTLPLQYWDWPTDKEGVMRDLNNSEEDVFILPYLEMSFHTDFKIISKSSGKCLEISNSSLFENATIEQSAYTGNSSQHWSLFSVSEGYFKIISSHSGLCLEVKDASINNGTSIVQGSYKGKDNQHWRLEKIDDLSYALIAKHSEKCLQIFNESLDDGALVEQSTYSKLSNQIWFIEPINNIIANQSELVDYGISVELNKTLIPLTPIWDYGVVPAFNGKMYYPKSDPLNFSADFNLIWKVYGKPDTPIVAFIANNGDAVTINNTNMTAVANSSDITDYEIFEWVDLGSDRVALKACNGKFLTLSKNDGKYYIIQANSTEIGKDETFDILSISGNNIALKANNDLYLTIKNPYDDSYELSATSKIIGSDETFTKLSLGYKSDPVPLVSYYEDFMFTGFNIQENYGTDIACFYNNDINQTLKAGFVMAYGFLRNHTDLSNISHVLENRNISVNITIQNDLKHQDESIFKLMNEILPETLSDLNKEYPNSTLPIIIALEDHFTSISMDEIIQGYIAYDNNFQLDITSEPIITSKMFKMNWYNTTDFLILDTEYVLLEVMRWGLSLGIEENDDNLLTLMALLNIWNLGEYKVTNIGGTDIQFNIDESPLVLDIIQYNIFTISTVLDILSIITKFNKIGEYRILAFIGKYLKPLKPALLNAIKTAIKTLKLSKIAQKSLNALKSIGAAIKSSKACQSILKFFKSAKVASVLDKIGVVLVLIDLAITGVIAFYMFWSILFEQGFSDFGAALGAWVVIFSFVYAGFYIALALALPIVGIILAILDMIFDFFGDLLEWFLDLVTKTEIRSSFDLGFIGTPSLETHDFDNNGFDVGDKINFSTQLYAHVWRTSDGNTNDLKQSYVNPSLKVSVPEGSNTGSSKIKISTITDDINFRNETYDLGVWTYPIAMSNYPMTIQLSYSYKRFYDECVWFFGWWCDRESDSGTQTTDITTLYFDVLPGNLTSFLYWSELRPLDSDGDGLSDKEELLSASNPWRVDTDKDGLWDRYEIDREMLPYKADSDGDGLNDGIEIRIDTDFNNTDCDEDGLNDYEEYRGWSVNFDFFGTTFSMNISSDPMTYDTDNDGLNDLVEFMKGLNPRSNDTDGDGILDIDENIFSYRGFIKSVNFNNKGSSIRVTPNSTIDADIKYRLFGIECPNTSSPANCSIVLTIENSDSRNIIMNQTIFNGSTDLFNLTENTTSFSFNASEEEEIYLVKYYVNWSCYGILPPVGDREIIGIIDVNASGGGSSQWECYDLSGGDKDGDFISNINENIGWIINYTDSTGNYVVHVTSDPLSIDTDLDGEWDIWEHNCFENSTNPRDPDTDHDGLTDWEEKYRYKTNPLNYDTDGDGLDDQNELKFGSDPFNPDSDNDGLSDKIEFDLKSNPNNPDTDYDGLNDYDEYLFNSSLILPDTDYDNLFDKMEYNLTTNPRNPDTDGDQLIDGYEMIVNTNPKKADTDNDTLNDFDELYWHTDPLDDDSDNDTLVDGKEIFYGTHPLIGDTDRDGIDDFEDYDTYLSHVDDIILTYDLDEDILEFEEHLEIYSNVTTVPLEQLISNTNYKNSPFIVLVGKLDAGDGTVGNLSKTILESTGENTTAIIEKGYNFFAVKYGIWNKTQTIVMLSHPYRLDHLIVLNIFKTIQKYINGSNITIKWPTPRDMFMAETVNEIGTLLWVYLNQNVTPWISLTSYNDSTTPNILTRNLGLGSNEKSVERYINIKLSDNVQNEIQDIINYAMIFIYYTASDLDKTGDGDANDVGDLNEKTLSFYVFDEENDRWVKLSKNLEWVNDCGVDTTNVEIYGKTYEGYIWANVSHFSLYGFAGDTITKSEGGDRKIGPYTTNPKPIANASASERYGFINTPVKFDGSLSMDDGEIVSYSWDFDDGSYGTGITVNHEYKEGGKYNVKLIVTDNLGAIDIDSIEVIISQPNIPPTKPTIDGPTTGNINTNYKFTSLSTDEDSGDQIKYGWDWDNDEIIDDWTDLFLSQETSIIYHSFSEKGLYRIKAVAEDKSSARSEWSDRLLLFIDIDYNLQNDGTYLIDYDRDGKWDKLYDVKSDELTDFEDKKSEEGIPIIIIVILILILLLFIFLIFNPKRKKQL